MDIGDTIAPDSDQLDAVDLLTGPRTFTIAGVRTGNGEQPVQIDLAEFPRPWRPGKSMRRVLVTAWGPAASEYVGRRVELYCDPDVTFGKDKVGGTRIARLSHIDGPLSVPLLVSRGRSATFRVEPLTDDAGQSNAQPASATQTATDKQVQRIGILATDLGLDRDQKLAGVAKTIGRAVETTKDLTPEEASACIESMQAVLDARQGAS